MKQEWKKHEKEIYLPKTKPEIIDVPAFNFFTISGKGDPNQESFGEAVGALYSLAYGIKMLPKKGITPEGYIEYTVYPLEGVWDLDESAKGVLDKSQFLYTIMIRQPAFVTAELAEQVLAATKEKKPNPWLEKTQFETIQDGLCVQMMHVGPYDDEPRSFEIMEAFCAENKLARTSKTHREIYISDPGRTTPEKLKTVLRIFVTEEN